CAFRSRPLPPIAPCPMAGVLHNIAPTGAPDPGEEGTAVMRISKLFFGAAALALAVPSAAQAQDCDRQCLIAMADGYAAALVAHDPSKAPLAADLRTVE